MPEVRNNGLNNINNTLVPLQPPTLQNIQDLKWDIFKKELQLGVQGTVTGGMLFMIEPVLPIYGLMKAIPNANLAYYKDKVRLDERQPWIRPEFAEQINGITPDDPNVIYARRLEEMKVAIDYLETSLKQELPKELKAEFAALRDPIKRRSVIDANAAEAAIAIYLYARIIAVINVATRPDVSILTHGADMVLALGLLIGEFAVRGFCTWGFQESMLKALQMNGEFYKTTPEERRQVTGFDPCDKYGIKMLPDDDSRRLTLANVGYIYQEQDVFQKYLWGFFLLETKDRLLYMNCNSGMGGKGANIISGYFKNRDTVLSFAENLKGITSDAFTSYRENIRTGSYNEQEEITRLQQLICRIRDAYQRQGDYYRASAGANADNQVQGGGGAHDDKLAGQFFAHVKVWERRINDLNEERAALSKSEFEKRLNEYYLYLMNKFSCDILINLRGCERPVKDLEFYNNRLNSVRNFLMANDQGLLLEPLNEPNAREIIRIINADLASVGARFNSLSTGKLNSFIMKAVLEGLTGEEFLQMVLFEGVSQPPYEGGEKAGGRNYLYSKFGDTFVVVENELGTRYSFSKADWLGQGSGIIFNNRVENTINDSYNSLSRKLRLNRLDPNNTVTRDNAERIVNIIITETTSTSVEKFRENAANNEKFRIIERLSKSFIHDGNSIEQFARQVLAILKYDGKITWEVLERPDFTGSFDKDYVRKSIDTTTLEFDDTFRIDIPVYQRLAAAGRINITKVQNQQNYAYWLASAKGSDGQIINFPHPLEITGQAAANDQTLWYGAFRNLFKDIRGTLGKNIKKGTTVNDYIDKCSMIVLGKKTIDNDVLLFSAAVKNQMSANLNDRLNKENGTDVINWSEKNSEDLLFATGLLPGRDVHNAMAFFCGTCILDHLKGGIAYNYQYVNDRDGHVMARADVKFNTRTKKMELFTYLPKYAQFPGPAGTASKASEHKEICEGHVFSDADRITIRNRYGVQGCTVEFRMQEEKTGPYNVLRQPLTTVRFEHAIIKDRKGNVIKDIFWYYPSERIDGVVTSRNLSDISRCRRIETSYESGETIVRDYAVNGREYTETRLGRRREIRDVITCRVDDLNLIINNFRLIAEVNGYEVIARNGDDTVTVEVRLNMPEIRTQRVVLDENGREICRETLQTPWGITNDEVITEDAATSYKERQRGFELVVVPKEVGWSLPPEGWTSWGKQGFRWTDHQRTYLRELVLLRMHPTLKNATGWQKEQAMSWYQHPFFDFCFLNTIPFVYWGLTIFTEDGALPLKPDKDYLLWLLTFSYTTVGAYFRNQALVDQDSITTGEKIKAVWNKETGLTLNGAPYIDGTISSFQDMAKNFDITERLGRLPAPYKYLNANRFMKNLLGASVGMGSAFIAWQAYTGGGHHDVSSYIGWGLATAFPLLKYSMYQSGINNHYGFSVTFNEYAKSVIFMKGGNDVKVVENDATFEKKQILHISYEEKEDTKILSALGEFADITSRSVAGGRVHLSLRIRQGGIFNPLNPDTHTYANNPALRVFIKGSFWDDHDLKMYDKEVALSRTARFNGWVGNTLLPKPDPDLMPPLNPTFEESLYGGFKTMKNEFFRLSGIKKVSLNSIEVSVNKFKELQKKKVEYNVKISTMEPKEIDSLGKDIENLRNMINDGSLSSNDIKKAARLFIEATTIKIPVKQEKARTHMGKLLCNNNLCLDSTVLAVRLLTGRTLNIQTAYLTREDINNAANGAGYIQNDAAYIVNLTASFLSAFKGCTAAQQGALIAQLSDNNMVDLLQVIATDQGVKIADSLRGLPVAVELAVLQRMAGMNNENAQLADNIARESYGVDLATINSLVNGQLNDQAVNVILRGLKNEHKNNIAQRILGADRTRNVINAGGNTLNFKVIIK